MDRYQNSLSIQFTHEDIGAYFAAQGLMNRDWLHDFDQAHLYTWRRPLLMLAGLGKGPEIIDFLISKKTPYLLLLASECVKDGQDSQKAHRQVIDGLLENFQSEWAREELLRLGAADEFVNALVKCDYQTMEEILHDNRFSEWPNASTTTWITLLLEVQHHQAQLREAAVRTLQNLGEAVREVVAHAEQVSTSQAWRLRDLLLALISPHPPFHLLPFRSSHHQSQPNYFLPLFEALSSSNIIIAGAAGEILAQHGVSSEILEPVLARLRNDASEDIRSLSVSIYISLLKREPKLILEAASWAFSDLSEKVRNNAVELIEGETACELLCSETFVINALIQLLRPNWNSLGPRVTPPGRALTLLCLYNNDIVETVFNVVFDESYSDRQRIGAEVCFHRMCEMVAEESQMQTAAETTSEGVQERSLPSTAVVKALQHVISRIPNPELAAMVVRTLPETLGVKSWLIPGLVVWIQHDSREAIRVAALDALGNLDLKKEPAIQRLLISLNSDPSNEIRQSSYRILTTHFDRIPNVKELQQDHATRQAATLVL